MTYGCCELVGYTPGHRCIIEYRGLVQYGHDHWCEIEGLDKRFPDRKSAMLWAAAKGL